jgi:hypothetical protein
VGVKEDIQRAVALGKSTEYEAITSMPSYQAELKRTSKDYQERSWIDLTGFLPKFTTEEFDKRRIQYQAKYGNTVNVPGFNDVIHILPATKISTEEMAAHRWAQKRGLPSTLNEEQLKLLTIKKFRYLRALSSPAPTWLRTYGSVATAMDNVEDALVTLYWTGRLAVSIAPRLLGKAVPVLGWALIGSDILNLANLSVWAGALRRGCKSLHGQALKSNPFSAEARAEQALRLKKRTPGFGAILETLQTTDQLFGVGLCLGGLMGLVQDAALKAVDVFSAEPFKPPKPGEPLRFEIQKSEYLNEMQKVLLSGNVNEIADWASKAAINDYEAVKKGLKQQSTQFQDETFRLGSTYFNLQEKTHDWVIKKSKEAWEWLKTKPEEASEPYNDVLIGSTILSTGKQDFEKDLHTKAFIFLNQAMSGVMPWWYENDPIKNMKDIMNWKWRAPEPKEPDTIALLEESLHDWKDTVRWPHIDKREATFEEIGYSYASKIKESFQTYCLNYTHEYTSMAASSECIDFVKNVIRSYDDNHEVRISMTAHTAAAVDMIDQGHIIDPNTDQTLIDQLYDYIADNERKTSGPTKIKDIIRKGNELGINWIHEPPKEIPPKAEELFPGWRAMQDQLGELHIAD